MSFNKFPDKSPLLDEGFRIDINPFKRVELTAAQLWANAVPANANLQQLRDAAAVPSGFNIDSSSQYYGLEIEESSTFRAVQVFFDDDLSPVALAGGTTVIRRFSVPRFSTLTDAARITTNVGSNWLDSLGVAALLCPQRLRVRLWRRPPYYSSYDFPSYMEVSQRQLQIATGAALGTGSIMSLYAPGMREVRTWGSNGNNVNSAIVNVDGFLRRDQYNPDAAPLTTVVDGPQFAGLSVAVPAGADANAPVSGLQAAPTCSGLDFRASTVGGVGPYVVQFGVMLSFYPGQ